jgi:hypothetical protein
VSYLNDATQKILAAIARAGVPQPGVFATEDGSALIEWADKSEMRNIEVFESGLFELFDMKENEKQGRHSETRDIDEAIRFAIGREGEK